MPAAQPALSKPSCKELSQEEEGGADNGRGERITSRSGQTCPSAGPRRQTWIEQLGGKLSHFQWSPNNSWVKGHEMRDVFFHVQSAFMEFICHNGSHISAVIGENILR